MNREREHRHSRRCGNIHDIVPPRSQRTVERWFNTEAGFERDLRG
jgi:hypothetical protein